MLSLFRRFSTADTRLCRADRRWQSPGIKESCIPNLPKLHAKVFHKGCGCIVGGSDGSAAEREERLERVAAVSRGRGGLPTKANAGYRNRIAGPYKLSFCFVQTKRFPVISCVYLREADCLPYDTPTIDYKQKKASPKETLF